MSKTYLGILDKERQSIFQQLSQFKTDGYLAGGTALSLQIKHRKSFDFDIFIPKQITTSLKSKVRKIFKEPVYYIDSKDQISFRTANNINVTFLWYYFDYLFPLIPTDSLSLASIKDIEETKVEFINQSYSFKEIRQYLEIKVEEYIKRFIV